MNIHSVNQLDKVLNDAHGSNHPILEKTPEATTSTQRTLPLLGIGLSVLFATATFFSGLHIGSDTNLQANIFSIFSRETKADDTVDMTEFWRVWNLLNQKFVVSTASSTEPLTSEEKLDGAIAGLVKSYGDPYTIYMPPEDAAYFEDAIAGNFSGVGMEVGIREDMVTVIAPLPNSPAEKAGLIVGDTIVRIDGTSTEGMSIDEAVKLIRGEQGTQVKLTLFRKGEKEFREISITRDTINIPTSKTETKDDAFVISLYSFNALSEAEMQTALREYVRSKKSNLILDLRGNPGGYLQSAVAIASYFLPAGKTVVRESYGPDIEEDIYRSQGRELGGSAPKKFVVLVDGGSASASEILAGALKEQHAATIIGSQTFGKGSVQELVKLDNGGSLKVTIARWLTPDGTSISNGGLTPDIVVERTPEDREAGRDTQMEAALEFMKK